jgi:hypothetical protein
MSFGWSTILDTHGKLFSIKSQAALQFLAQTDAPGTYYQTLFKGTYIFALPIHPLNGTHTQSTSQLSQGLKILL